MTGGPLSRCRDSSDFSSPGRTGPGVQSFSALIVQLGVDDRIARRKQCPVKALFQAGTGVFDSGGVTPGMSTQPQAGKN